MLTCCPFEVSLDWSFVESSCRSLRFMSVNDVLFGCGRWEHGARGRNRRRRDDVESALGIEELSQKECSDTVTGHWLMFSELDLPYNQVTRFSLCL